jgi:hypothetical protein
VYCTPAPNGPVAPLKGILSSPAANIQGCILCLHAFFGRFKVRGVMDFHLRNEISKKLGLSQAEIDGWGRDPINFKVSNNNKVVMHWVNACPHRKIENGEIVFK